jgi:outer membrane protein TolC
MRQTILIFLTLIVNLCVVSAQDKVTLSDAIETGLENNFAIQIEKLNVEIAQNLNTYGETARYPSLNFNLSQNNSLNKLDNPNSFLRKGDVLVASVSPGVSLDWTIFNAFNVRINKNQLALLEEQSLGFSSLVVENTVTAIILAYYLLVLEEERLNVQQRVLNLSRDRYNYILLRQELGNAVTFDVLQQKNAYLTDSSNLIVQQLNLVNARRRLNEFLGIDIETYYEPIETLDIEAQTYSYDALYEKMSSNNVSLKNQFINQQLIRNQISASKVNLYPRIDMRAAYSRNYNWNKLSNPEFSNPDIPFNSEWVKAVPQNYFINFTLSWLLFDGGKVRRAIENAKIQESIGNLEIEELKLALNRELIAAIDLYETRIDLLKIADENVKTAELNLTLGEEKYRTGAISSIDYRIIQVEYLNTALDNILAKYELILANVDLMRLTGGIIAEYGQN